MNQICEPWTRRPLSLTADYLKNEDISIYFILQKKQMNYRYFPHKYVKNQVCIYMYLHECMYIYVNVCIYVHVYTLSHTHTHRFNSKCEGKKSTTFSAEGTP